MNDNRNRVTTALGKATTTVKDHPVVSALALFAGVAVVAGVTDVIRQRNAIKNIELPQDNAGNDENLDDDARDDESGKDIRP